MQRLTLFDAQHIVEHGDEPLDVCAAGSDLVLVASKSGTVSAYSVGSSRLLVHKFRTVYRHPLRVGHCAAADCVVTLEAAGDDDAERVVRIYSRWRKGSDAAPCPVAHPKDSKSDNDNRVWAYPVPLPGSTTPTVFTCCGATNRVAIALGRTITVFEISHQSARRLLEIDSSSPITNVVLHRSFIAYASRFEVRALAIELEGASPSPATAEDADATVRPSSPPAVAYAEIKTDQHHFECAFGEDGTPLISNHPDLTLSVPSIPVGRRVPGGKEPIEFFGPVADMDQGLRAFHQRRIVSSLMILFRRFPPDSPVHTLCILPEMQRGGQDGMRILMATPRQAFLYDLVRCRLVAVYSFNSDSARVIPGTCFLYSLTALGLEVYTMRWTPEDAQSDYLPPPFMISRQPFISLQTAAVVDDYVLLLSKFNELDALPRRFTSGSPARHGGHPGAPPSPSLGGGAVRGRRTSSQATLTPTLGGSGRREPVARVAEVSSPASPSGTPGAPPKAPSWNLYLLGLAPVSQIYHEILEVACEYENVMPARYYHMVLEGHFLLQARYGALLQHLEAFDESSATALVLAVKVEINNYRALLRRSSGLLADIFVNAADLRQAVKCFVRSDRPLSEVVECLSRFPRQEDKLIEYLDAVLFAADTEDLLDLDEDMGNLILEHYQSHAPHRLSLVILDSSLCGYSHEYAMQLLETNSGHRRSVSMNQAVRIRDSFVTALLALDTGHFDKAQSLLGALPESQLVALCVSHQHLVGLGPDDGGEDGAESVGMGVDGSPDEGPTEDETGPGGDDGPGEESTEADAEFPSLAQCLLSCAPWALLEILRQSETIATATALSLLGASLTDHHDDQLCRLLQECYIEARLLHPERSSAPDDNTEELRPVLLSMYLARIATSRPIPVTPEVDAEGLQATWREFHSIAWLSKRPPWLDALAPSEDLQDASPVVASYVKKAQAIISSAPSMDWTGVETALGAAAHEGQTSLDMLCAARSGRLDAAFAQLVQSGNLDTALNCAKQFCTSASGWHALFASLRKKYAPGDDALRSQVEAVLDYTSRNCSPDVFLEILPDDFSVSFCLRFIEQNERLVC